MHPIQAASVLAGYVRLGIGYELTWVRVGNGYELVLGTSWLGYDLAKYELSWVRVDRHPRCLGLETYQRLVSVSSREKLSMSRSREADVSVSAIYVSCPRPIFGQIVQATVRSVINQTVRSVIKTSVVPRTLFGLGLSLNSNWSRSRSWSHDVMVSGLIRVSLVISKWSFAFLIN